ncbi:sensor histidine kinase [Jeotgalibaca sp. MA1X17-3]|uniref:sensor histidine kinase n=1 Tax=Jeotgalibaca sp. MA1X17-3 TaxID=2908211 RepID=UPI001F42C214|nr:sensor histidine kinase [Jeotgalibaca sp. MA1X17-3]UJF15020.1 sensor histidine kinase [Jeotgalibaca sp. MA1X17-3]
MKIKTFFRFFFTLGLILLLTVLATLFSLRSFLSFPDLLSIENFSVPIFLFLGAVIFFLSLTFSWVLQHSLVKLEKEIVERLQLLNKGNYTIVESENSVTNNLFLAEGSEIIKEEINLLRSKLVLLSREVQELSSLPRIPRKETKEEILSQERHRIARELHDSVSQQLFAGMMILSAINEKADTLPENIQKQLAMVESIVNESQSEMRALLLHLRPVKLEGKTLKKGIEQLLNELRTKIQIKLKGEISSIDTIPGIEDHLFRIIQELLSNTLRHAKAKNLEVYLTQNSKEINLRIFDDGIGFDTSIQKTGSYGLMNIQERVTSLGGTLKIISFPNQGTIIDIRIPNTMES